MPDAEAPPWGSATKARAPIVANDKAKLEALIANRMKTIGSARALPNRQRIVQKRTVPLNAAEGLRFPGSGGSGANRAMAVAGSSGQWVALQHWRRTPESFVPVARVRVSEGGTGR